MLIFISIFILSLFVVAILALFESTYNYIWCDIANSVLVALIVLILTMFCKVSFSTRYKQIFTTNNLLVEDVDADFFAVQTITTVGYGFEFNNSPKHAFVNREIKKLAINAMIIGAIIWSLFLASVIRCFDRVAVALEFYHQNE